LIESPQESGTMEPEEPMKVWPIQLGSFRLTGSDRSLWAILFV